MGDDYSGLGLMYIDLLLAKMCRKNVFIPSDLDLWPLYLKFAPLVTVV